MDIREEFEFTLPLGYKDKDGIIHKTGVMRRSRAKDEIVLLQDMRVQRNRAYRIIALLGRVVTQLGSLKDVNTGVVENLFASDLRFLEEMYNRINEDEVMISVKCPECGANFEKEFGRLGEL